MFLVSCGPASRHAMTAAAVNLLLCVGSCAGTAIVGCNGIQTCHTDETTLLRLLQEVPPAWPQASKTAKALTEKEIWQRMEHLYAPLHGTWSGGVVLHAEQSTDIATLLQLMSIFVESICDYHFVAELSASHSIHLAQRMAQIWFGIADLQSKVVYKIDEKKKAVIGSWHGITQSWSYTGDRFGCVHNRQSCRANCSKYDFTIDQPNPIVDGTAKAAIDKIASGFQANYWPFLDGIVDAGLQKIVHVIFATPDTHAVLVSHKGRLFERYNSEIGISASTRLRGWSLSKGIESLLLGARHSEGKLDLDAYIKAPEVTYAEKVSRNLTIGNLVNMRIGHPMEENMAGFLCFTADHASAFVRGSPNTTSSPRFGYSTAAAIINARELRYSFADGAKGHRQYASYPWKALFSKIGALSFVCESNPEGILMLGAFCWATPRDWLKIGKLVMQQGFWEGKQVIPSEWILKSTEVVPDSNPEYTHGWYRLDQLYPRVNTR
eukprot:gnl/TRDRNA2_/TRDRNA2_174596_c0_seq1.p1 gnl/TRDRNA2_/TRDRNA2_174596_c0~~gnl/TRDRNA2_/TRDRNA2_174596_c0_seq1.p1  ORF type:complete len:493 (+),score=39.97 gnl/TRDRNA2_/TRDRNA2_174596_c0_seq1:99-1577(+)